MKYVSFDIETTGLDPEYCQILGKPKYNICGKNVAGFDLKFTPPAFNWLFRHRVIDVGSVFFDPSRYTLSSLDELKKLCNIAGEVTHDPLEDARDVILCMRVKTNGIR